MGGGEDGHTFADVRAPMMVKNEKKLRRDRHHFATLINFLRRFAKRKKKFSYKIVIIYERVMDMS